MLFRSSFVEFYSRRIRRIFPALTTVLVACYTFGWFALLKSEYRQLGKHIAGGAGFISNLLLWRESGYFDPDSATKPLLHLWSLGIEEQFYIVWPGALLVMLRLRNNLAQSWVTVRGLVFLVSAFGAAASTWRMHSVALAAEIGRAHV